MSTPGSPGDPDDNDEELLDLAEHFGQVDADGDRRIDFAEFSRLVENLSDDESDAPRGTPHRLQGNRH